MAIKHIEDACYPYGLWELEEGDIIIIASGKGDNPMHAITYILCGSYAEFDLWTRSNFPYLQGPTKHRYFAAIYERDGADKIQSVESNMFYIVLDGFYSLREDDRTYIKVQVSRRSPIKIVTLDLQPSFVPTLVIR